MCCDIVALVCLSFSLLYYLFCDGTQALTSSTWENFEMIEEEFDKPVETKSIA